MFVSMSQDEDAESDVGDGQPEAGFVAGYGQYFAISHVQLTCACEKDMDKEIDATEESQEEQARL